MKQIKHENETVQYWSIVYMTEIKYDDHIYSIIDGSLWQFGMIDRLYSEKIKLIAKKSNNTL